MQIFYKFFKEKNKFILIFLIFSLINLFFAYRLQSKADYMDKKLESYRSHLNFSGKVSHNLLGECSLFQEKNSFSLYLKKELNKSKFSFELSRERVVAFKDLVFYEVFFSTFPNSEPNIKSTSVGYMVEHINSKKCYGII